MTEPDDEAFVAQSLSALPKVEPSRDLLRRVAQIPLEHPRQRDVFSARQWTFGLLAAALLGLAAGWLTLSADELDKAMPVAADTDSKAPSVDEATQADEELESMLALALGADESSFDDGLGEQ